ncbi:protein Wnt-4 [Plodia interpunctella]|uniref:protein Wnt-4 n=1 Tax=Plodia interpunctella TaxID=58824 RepID=UPI00236803DF|nr:protein Wnt-4 [Plodia interpunctella]
MFSFSVIGCLLFYSVSILATKNVEGSQPTLQKTVQALFTERSQVMYPGACKLIRSSLHQSKMCKRNPGLAEVLQQAKDQAIRACEEAFQYDRWNCSLVFNNKAKRSIFNKIYRETAFVHALIAASVTHTVAKACASGDLTRCSCTGINGKNSSFKVGGCGDDFKQGKRITRHFLEINEAGYDQIGEILKQDVTVGVDAMAEQMREVCKCHGFSGSCTTKTCWKRLGPFNSVMGLLKKQFHHAIKQRIVNYTTKRAITPRVRKKMKIDRKSLVYLHKTPNLCVSTKGRVCKDRNNCATLCCGRGFVTSHKTVNYRCKCKMVDCCFVKCDTCSQVVDVYTCK